MCLNLTFRKIVLSPSLLFFAFNIYAQKSFQDGFVITTKRDTLVGRLSNIHKNAHAFIDFRQPYGDDTILTPNHIIAYEMGNQRYVVVPVPHPTKKDTTYLFARVLVDGYASLYKTKIKLDPITAPEEAFLCKKFNENTYHPAGKIKNLANFFNDNPTLANELNTNTADYTNNEETKIQIFNQYNGWKKKQVDSIDASKNVRVNNIKVEKHQLEVFMSDSLNLTPESKYELDKISGKLTTEPNLRMEMEFVKTNAKPYLQKQTMKAVLTHLNEYDARIDERVISIPKNQQIVTSKPNGQILFYYFR